MLNSFSGTDTCGTATVTHNNTGLNYDCDNLGSENVTFTLSDGCGNFMTKSATFTIQSILGINTYNLENLTVYPNPTNGNFTISFNLISKDNIIIKIYDTEGRIIDLKEFENYPSNLFFETFDYSYLPSGIFFILIKNDTLESTKQITKV